MKNKLLIFIFLASFFSIIKEETNATCKTCPEHIEDGYCDFSQPDGISCKKETDPDKTMCSRIDSLFGCGPKPPVIKT